MGDMPGGEGDEFLNYDLNTAADIQKRLIPKEIPKIHGYDLSAYYRPCKKVSGDYFDFIKLDEKRHGMLIADVSGKGLSAGFIMAQVRTFMHNNLQVLGSPCLTAVSLNDYLRKTIPHGMFVTMFYYVLHVPTGQLAMVNCGHNPMAWFQSLSKEVKMIGQQGMALGIASKAIFQETLHEVKIHLSADDLVLIYTDGVTEAMNPEGEEFEDHRVAGLVKKHAKRTAQESLEWIIRELYNFTGTTNLPDDVTMLALKKLTSVRLPDRAEKRAGNRLLTINEASKRTGVSEDIIRDAVKNGQVRSQFVENVWDYMIPEIDVVRLGQMFGEGGQQGKPRVLLVGGTSEFTDILSLELKRNKKVEMQQVGVSPDAIRVGQQFDPGVILFEFTDMGQKVTQILSDLKKVCPVAEFMVFMENPEFVTKQPEVANLFRLLNVKHTFDKQKGSRPILMLLSSKIKGQG
jgi:hypothetical protein